MMRREAYPYVFRFQSRRWSCCTYAFLCASVLLALFCRRRLSLFLSKEGGGDVSSSRPLPFVRPHHRFPFPPPPASFQLVSPSSSCPSSRQQPQPRPEKADVSPLLHSVVSDTTPTPPIFAQAMSARIDDEARPLLSVAEESAREKRERSRKASPRW